MTGSGERRDASSPRDGKRSWRAPKLTEYGHIGKLTQAASGRVAETFGTKKLPCL